MKLAKDVLVEIIDIVRTGLSEGKDISELLREMDLVIDLDGQVALSGDYKARKGRVV